MRIAAALLSMMTAVAAQAGPPTYVSYRAALVAADGRAVAGGTYELVFSIHDAAVAGNQLFAQLKTAHVENGWYEVHLTDEPGAPLLQALWGSPRFLEVEIRSGGGFVEQVLSPRQQLSSAPWALVAARVEQTAEPPDALPASAIVLWDQATGCEGAPATCPCGFSLATEFDGRTILGALDDAAHTPGGSIGAPGGSGDVLTENELPSHTHELAADGLHRHEWRATVPSTNFIAPMGLFYNLGGPEVMCPAAPCWDGGVVHGLLRADQIWTTTAGSHGHAIGTAGEDGPHYHPFRTVLFCRKDEPS